MEEEEEKNEEQEMSCEERFKGPIFICYSDWLVAGWLVGKSLINPCTDDSVGESA